MTKDDIIRMARDSKLEPLSGHYNDPTVHRFASLVAAAVKKCADQDADMQEQVFADRMEIAIAAERERCAKLCEDARASIWEYHPDEVKQAAKNTCANLAAKIRALK